MRENVALGKGLFDRLAYDVGPLRLSMGEKHANAGKNVQWYLLPGSLVGLAANIAYRSDWNEKATLYSGTIVFDYYRKGDFLGYDTIWVGRATGNIVTMNHAVPYNASTQYYDPEGQKAFSDAYNHEQVHAVQYRELGSVDLLLQMSEKYRRVENTLHVNISSDLVIAGRVALPGNSAEFVPGILVAETVDTKPPRKN